MATPVEVPALGESVTQAILIRWHKADGEAVAADEPICELETDKANVDVPAPGGGVLRRVKEEGETVNVGEVIARIEPAGVTADLPSPAEASSAPTAAAAPPLVPPAPPPAPSAPTSPAAAPAAADPLADLSPAVRRLVEENHLDPGAIPPTGPGGRLTKEDVLHYVEEHGNHHPAPTPPPAPAPPAPSPTARPTVVAATAPTTTRQPASESLDFDNSGVRRVPLSRIRQRIAQRLVEAQQTAAILTTFNEVDLCEVQKLRGHYKDRFQEVHGVGLGLMSFFARAVVLALKEFPRLNAFLENNEIVYHRDVHLGIAVSTDRGLAVPVLRNVQKMSFGRIEAEIKRLATATREGKLAVEELSGGTFSITNGGIFGSLLSTPILNPPQSGILGLHALQKRPVVIDDKIEIRPMMYVALSYDHRIVDGKESISFLVRVKQLVEDPARLMLEI